MVTGPDTEQLVDETLADRTHALESERDFVEPIQVHGQSARFRTGDL